MSKERPILFSAPMVQALLAGRKTQTRRIAKLPFDFDVTKGDWYPDLYRGKQPHTQWTFWERKDGRDTGRSVLPYFTCPYGVPGDRLWVRETWMTVDTTGSYGDLDAIDIAYRATDGREWGQGRTTHFMTEEKAAPYSGANFSDRWRPSIHMPRWASRLNLVITNVRLERLHDISDADAWAEGVEVAPGSTTRYQGEGRELFFDLWRTINGEASLDANPWVWVVEFKVVTV